MPMDATSSKCTLSDDALVAELILRFDAKVDQTFKQANQIFALKEEIEGLKQEVFYLKKANSAYLKQLTEIDALPKEKK